MPAVGTHAAAENWDVGTIPRQLCVSLRQTSNLPKEGITYNVYFGTFSLFGAAGHQHGAGAASHRVLFNVTGQIQALQTGGAPKVTFVRRGPDEDNARPTIGHVLLVES